VYQVCQTEFMLLFCTSKANVPVFSFTAICSAVVPYSMTCAQHWANCAISANNILLFGSRNRRYSIQTVAWESEEQRGSHSDSCKRRFPFPKLPYLPWDPPRHLLSGKVENFPGGWG
jgi:hypothetical protein